MNSQKDVLLAGRAVLSPFRSLIQVSVERDGKVERITERRAVHDHGAAAAGLQASWVTAREQHGQAAIVHEAAGLIKAVTASAVNGNAARSGAGSAVASGNLWAAAPPGRTAAAGGSSSGFGLTFAGRREGRAGGEAPADFDLGGDGFKVFGWNKTTARRPLRGPAWPLLLKEAGTVSYLPIFCKLHRRNPCGCSSIWYWWY